MRFFWPKVEKTPLKEERKTINFAFASIIALKNIKKGEKLNIENIWVKRPAGGIFLQGIFTKLGKKALRNIKADEQLKKGHFLMKKSFLTGTRADFGKMRSIILSLKTKKFKWMFSLLACI